MACRSVAIHPGGDTGPARAHWPVHEPGRPLSLPGPPTQSTESSVARDLLLAALDPHVRDHADVDVAFRDSEALPVHGNVLDPRLEGVLVQPVDDRDVANVLLDDRLGLLVDLQSGIGIRFRLALVDQIVEFGVRPRLALSGGLL